MIVGTECYYVPNRFEKDKSNRHIIIIALNHEGIRELNDIISESNITGMYYKPRIDDELLFSLTPSNFIITTACVAGLWNDKELILRLKDYFGFNFYCIMCYPRYRRSKRSSNGGHSVSCIYTTPVNRCKSLLLLFLCF